MAAVPGRHAPAAQLLVDGQSNLLAGHRGLDRAKRVLRTLEEKDLMVRLLDRTLTAPGICVFIGAEANLPDLTDISVVAASYGGEGRPLGTIGVIGPSRMNYSKVIPLVDFTAEVITEALPEAIDPSPRSMTEEPQTDQTEQYAATAKPGPGPSGSGAARARAAQRRERIAALEAEKDDAARPHAAHRRRVRELQEAGPQASRPRARARPASRCCATCWR